MSFDLWLTEVFCPGVFSRPNYRAWVNVKPLSVESRCVQCDEGGCLYVGGVIKRAAGVGTSRS